MENLDLLNGEYWQPLAAFDFVDPFFNLNKETIVSTWALLAILFLICLPIRFLLTTRFPIARFVIVEFVDWFAQLSKQTLGIFSFNHFSLVTSLFIFIFVGSMLALIPGLEEPTQDLNTTLALGLIAFTYIQLYTIKEFGLWGYTKKEYLSPLLMFPLHVIGKIATVVSLSFRLFGNIFGGATISGIFFNLARSHWLAHIIALSTGINFVVAVFFGIFEGFLQAFVFAMLTLTYLSISLENESH